MKVAVTREIGPSLADCELTHVERAPIDVERARRQHAEYCDLLRGLGWDVITLPALDGFPDAVFVEDTAVVLNGAVVMCRPGADSRRGEIASVRECLAVYRPVMDVTQPGSIDGGDVLVIGTRVWIGLSSRTNADAVEQVRANAEPFGYTVRTVEVRDCLHLKSAATAASDGYVVVNPDWVSPEEFDGLEVVLTDPAEPHGANVLNLGEVVAVASAHPRTRDRIAGCGLATVSIDADELAKAEGGVTCCSLLVYQRGSEQP